MEAARFPVQRIAVRLVEGIDGTLMVIIAALTLLGFAALFSASDGELIHSIDTKKRITQARFSADGNTLVLAGALGQPARKNGEWPEWGRVQAYRLEL